jgi:hypothetical protein
MKIDTILTLNTVRKFHLIIEMEISYTKRKEPQLRYSPGLKSESINLRLNDCFPLSFTYNLHSIYTKKNRNKTQSPKVISLFKEWPLIKF